jgi:hypothetical protein
MRIVPADRFAQVMLSTAEVDDCATRFVMRRSGVINQYTHHEMGVPSWNSGLEQVDEECILLLLGLMRLMRSVFRAQDAV